MEWVVAPAIAIVYVMILMLGVKIIGNIPYLPNVLFGVEKKCGQ